MNSSIIDIGYPELIGAAALMLVAGFVSWKLALGQTKNIIVSSIRAFIQLLAIGFLLIYIFRYQSWWLILLCMGLMIIAATQISLGRVKNTVRGLWPMVFVSIFVSSITAALAVTELIIHPDPWYSARQLIPITGIAIGNTVSATAIAIDRLFNDMDSRSNEIFTMLALGATPKEAAFPSIKSAVAAGMTPVLASLSAAGIVKIPGMMSGQILAGADPVIAAKYQIVVLLMHSAATTAATVLVCYLTYKKRFSADGYYLDKGIRDDPVKKKSSLKALLKSR